MSKKLISRMKSALHLKDKKERSNPGTATEPEPAASGATEAGRVGTSEQPQGTESHLSDQSVSGGSSPDDGGVSLQGGLSSVASTQLSSPQVVESDAGASDPFTSIRRTTQAIWKDAQDKERANGQPILQEHDSRMVADELVPGEGKAVPGEGRAKIIGKTPLPSPNAMSFGTSDESSDDWGSPGIEPADIRYRYSSSPTSAIPAVPSSNVLESNQSYDGTNADDSFPKLRRTTNALGIAYPISESTSGFMGEVSYPGDNGTIEKKDASKSLMTKDFIDRLTRATEEGNISAKKPIGKDASSLSATIDKNHPLEVAAAIKKAVPRPEAVPSFSHEHREISASGSRRDDDSSNERVPSVDGASFDHIRSAEALRAERVDSQDTPAPSSSKKEAVEASIKEVPDASKHTPSKFAKLKGEPDTAPDRNSSTANKYTQYGSGIR